MFIIIGKSPKNISWPMIRILSDRIEAKKQGPLGVLRVVYCTRMGKIPFGIIFAEKQWWSWKNIRKRFVLEVKCARSGARRGLPRVLSRSRFPLPTRCQYIYLTGRETGRPVHVLASMYTRVRQTSFIFFFFY